ncbi:MAG: hypothetical protein WC916_05835 [Candidatus Woesearchaeota archaeon]
MSKELSDIVKKMHADKDFGIGAYAVMWYKGVFGITMKKGYIYYIDDSTIGLTKGKPEDYTFTQKYVEYKKLTHYNLLLSAQTLSADKNKYHLGDKVSLMPENAPLFSINIPDVQLPYFHFTKQPFKLASKLLNIPLFFINGLSASTVSLLRKFLSCYNIGEEFITYLDPHRIRISKTFPNLAKPKLFALGEKTYSREEFKQKYEHH